MVEGEPGGGGGGMEEALLVTRAMLPCCAVRLSGGPSGTGMGEGVGSEESWVGGQAQRGQGFHRTPFLSFKLNHVTTLDIQTVVLNN